MWKLERAETWTFWAFHPWPMKGDPSTDFPAKLDLDQNPSASALSTRARYGFVK
jgi:hypothetical protein